MDLFFGSDSDSSSSEDEEVELAIAVGDRIVKNMTTGRKTTSSLRLTRPRMLNVRNSIEAHKSIVRDYFANPPAYSSDKFRRRFRMNRDLFIRIKDAVVAHDSYFVQKSNAAAKLGLSSFQKITAAFRILAYGNSGDLFDEYIKIGESSATESVKRFCKAVIAVFGEDYLRRPNKDDTARLLEDGKKRGFPGMLGSIDCMQWEWKNCPTQWSGMYTGRCDRSPLLNELVDGEVEPVNFSINGHDYEKGYYLADGIYLMWATFVKTIPAPIGVKKTHFAKVHESLRKDVERAFGVLQARFAIVRGPARYYNQDDLKVIMMACVIMHNMIVENERHLYLNAADYEYDQDRQSPPDPDISVTNTNDIQDFIARHLQMRDSTIHAQLRDDLVEHLWNLYSES